MPGCYVCNKCGNCQMGAQIANPPMPKCLDCGYVAKIGESFTKCARCGSMRMTLKVSTDEETK